MLGFRVWDSEKKEFICSGDGHVTMSQSGKLVKIHDNFSVVAYSEMNDRYIPLQSTGLKDEAENIIFEGDIIEFRSIDVKCEMDMSYFILVDNVTDFLLTWNREYFENDATEPVVVIGNKFENEELLEKVKC